VTTMRLKLISSSSGHLGCHRSKERCSCRKRRRWRWTAWAPWRRRGRVGTVLGGGGIAAA
jgi:hypothetical protein